MGRLARLIGVLPALTFMMPASAEIVLLDPTHDWRAGRDRPVATASRPAWPSDFGVAGGRCNTLLIGAMLGGPMSLPAGTPPGGNQRHVAILAGSLIGRPLGASLGQTMDAVDRGCIGHALELAPPNLTVAWSKAGGRIAYALTPLRRHALLGQSCREFLGRVTVDGRNQPFRGFACSAGEGVWRLV